MLAAVLASKIIAIGPLVVPAGVMAYCLTFLITDVVSEIWGAHLIEGFIHDASGFVVFALAFVILYVINKVIE